MRRFSRRRRAGAQGTGQSPIDAERWLARICEAGSATRLEPVIHEEVADHYAAVGRGERDDGTPVVVAFSPQQGGDALMAALVTGMRLAEQESYSGEVLAIAPQWSVAARRRLAVVRAELPFRLSAVAVPTLAEGDLKVEPETALEPSVVPVDQVAAHLADPIARDLFARAASALDGLASKHGGCLRGVGHAVELVIMARRVAELRAEDNGIVLTTLQPQRSTVRLSLEGLAGALDGLEGQLRRRLNDRRVRDSEEGLRARLLPLLARSRSLRQVVAWPLGGGDRDEIDLFGLDSDGRPVVAAARMQLSLEMLGRLLDAVQSLRLALPTLLVGATPPARLELPRLLLAAQEYGPGAIRALSGISLAHDLFEVRPDGRDSYALVSVGAEEATRARSEGGGRSERGGRSGRGRHRELGDEARPGRDPSETEPAAEKSEASAVEESERSAGRGRSRRRGKRRGRGRDDGADEAPETTGDARESTTSEPARPRFQEMSLLDVEEDSASSATPEESGRRRGRGRSRRRSRVSGRGDEAGANEVSGGAASPGGDGSNDEVDRGERSGSGRGSDEDDDALTETLDEGLAELPEEEIALIDEAARAQYKEDEEGGSEGDDRALERTKRRLVRTTAVEEVVEPPKPRRRAVVVAQADRDSLLSAVLLARDIRLLEGLWIYPQSDLMSFFREVTPDIRDDVPIYMVGFVPSPAVDVLQAAGLYSDRLTWFDHHVWPPEDAHALRQTIGDDSVHHAPGVGSSLPVVLGTCTRRSRFSDKLADLGTGRFTQHDYERWGRLWWWRLGQIAAKSGDVRKDIEPLLAGRPSDLAKEAAKVESPPIPEEVAWVSSRDFRLVHFAGYSMVVLEIEGDLDPHVASRIARERYGALLSLTHRKGETLFHFAGEELNGRHVLDFGALAEHLANKLEWVESMADNDHVARFSVQGLDEHPERLDAVIGEIAMGRSILER